MRKILLSTMVTGALALFGSGTALAQSRGGGHSGPVMGRVGPSVGVGGYNHHAPGAVIVAPYRVYGPGFGYDPFWNAGFGYGYGPYVVPAGPVTGGLRLEVTPKTAQVFVDGYYAGVVDDFDGHFQHLDLTPGGHAIDVRADGFAPLTFNAYAQPDHTTDYKGALAPTGAEPER
ncbi:MAG TPA: hypothetical protein VGH34_08640 [Vicinamibacterales bacterium]